MWALHVLRGRKARSQNLCPLLHIRLPIVDTSAPAGGRHAPAPCMPPILNHKGCQSNTTRCAHLHVHAGVRVHTQLSEQKPDVLRAWD